MKELKLDYASDIHLRHYLISRGPEGFEYGDIRDFVQRYILPKKQGNVLVVAGDISDFIYANIEFLEECANYYDHILYVLGNHEYYLSNDQMRQEFHNSSKEKVQKMIELLNLTDKITVLDRNNPRNHGIISIDDFTIAGDTLWYMPLEFWDWHHFTANSYDSSLIQYANTPVNGIQKLHEESMNWYDSINCDVDLMVTHVPPIYNPNPNYEANTCFYTPVRKTKSGIWIYGHDHLDAEFEHEGTLYLSNPYGFEKKNPEVKTLTLKKK